MKNVLITTSSLKNISGVTSLVKLILKHKKSGDNYILFRVGRIDGQTGLASWLLDQLLLVPRLMKTFLFRKIDFLHLNLPLEKKSVIRDFLIFATARYIFQRKILVHIHGGKLLMYPSPKGSVFFRLTATMLRQAAVVIVLSKTEQAKIFQTFGIEAEVLPNAVEVGGDNSEKPFSKHLTLIFLGRIVASKGIFVLEKALHHLSAFYHQFDLVIYGSGPDTAAFAEALGKVNGLNYRFAGVVNDQQKEVAFKNAQLFLLPSIHSEGLPLALLEAMESGCVPIVSTDASMPEVIDDGENGFLVKPGDELNLAEVLRAIIAGEKSLPAVSAKARETVRLKFGIHAYIRRLDSFHNFVMEAIGQKSK